MAQFDIQVQGGRFRMEVPADVEYIALDIIKRLVDGLHSLSTLTKSCYIEVKIQKGSED